MSIDIKIGVFRNLGFLRFFVLFIAINYFFFYFKNFDNIFKIFLIVLTILAVDIFIQKFTGENILGFKPENPHRMTGFFNEERIAGAYILGFFFPTLGYFLTKNNFKIFNINFIFVIFILLFIAIILTGERSNSIKALLGIFIFLFFSNHFKLKEKIISFLLLFSFLLISYFNSEALYFRYGTLIFNNFSSIKKIKTFYNKSLYFKLYNSGFEVFKKNPFLGVGNKNYRIETCIHNDNKESINIEKINPLYVCNTHPHQIYIELLAEHGLIGFFIIIGILFYLTFRLLKKIMLSKNYTQFGCLIYILLVFVPLLPSGSFFSNFNATLFWINFSLMYAVNYKTNIYYKIL
tara:strand:- start:1362 stop:2408 length:1047 start_codon:yes stop_codon:yes gene_type:complete